MADDRAILRGYLSVFTGDLGRLLVFAAFIPLLVRTVGEAGFGTYALVMATFLPSRKVLNLGLFEATKTYTSRNEGDERDRVVVTSLALHLGSLLIGIPVLAGVVTLLAEGTLADALYLMLAAVVGEQLYFYGRGVLHAYKREALVEPLIPVRSIILAAVGLGLAAAGYGVPGVFAGYATGFLLTGIVSTTLALWVSGVVPSPRRLAVGVYGRPLVRFGVQSMALVLLVTSMYKIDILLVSYFLDATRTGHYRAALQVSEFMWVVSVSMEMVMIQSTAGLWQRGAIGEITSITSRFLRYVVVVTVLLMAGVFVLSEQFLTVYFGDPYEASVRPLRILLPGVLGFAVARVVWPVLQAGDHLRKLLVATGTAVLANVVLNLILIPRFGIIGAAVGTATAYGSMAVTHILAARSVGLAPLSGVPIGRIGLLGAVTAGLLVALEPLGPWYVDLGLLPIVGLAAYAVGSQLLGLLTIGEAREMARSFAE
ncbi:MAG: polysaccharide biosynthesis C-terminal domain-containing protein [Halobacteriales archaeon]